METDSQREIVVFCMRNERALQAKYLQRSVSSFWEFSFIQPLPALHKLLYNRVLGVDYLKA